MNFNFGEILSGAWLITWKHKVLWLAGIFITLVSLLSLPISLIFNDPASMMMLNDPAEVNRRMVPILLANGLIFLVSIASIPIYVIGMTIPSLATHRIESGNNRMSFVELTQDSLRYFWRILGIFALIWMGTVIVILVFTACIGLMSVVTLGLASLCAIPIFFLFIPLAIIVYSYMEQGISAVVVDDLRMSVALQRAWELVRNNLGTMAILSIIIYLGSIILGMFISIPLLIPVFGLMRTMDAQPDPIAVQIVFRNMTWWMLALSPFYAIIQGILLTFMQSAWTLTYIRLTRKPDSTENMTPGTPPSPSLDDPDKTIISSSHA